MKICIALVCSLLAAGASAQTEDAFDRGYALAGKKGCFECHALGRDYVGPSFRAIAERYRMQPESRAQLAETIRSGSRGHWGERFNMWPQVHFTEAELTRLVDWVLMQ
jgi:cytochrome c